MYRLRLITFAESVSVDDLPDNNNYIPSYLGSARGGASLRVHFLGNTPTRIGNKTFKESRHLKDITLPTGLQELGAETFYDCDQLEYIIIPEGIERIEDATFGSCALLETVHLPKNLKHIGKDNFTGLEKTEMNRPCVVLGKPLETIGAESFTKGLFEKLILPSTLQQIDAGAFSNCEKLKEIICYVETPIALDASTFSRTLSLKECTLYVPQNSKAAYEAAEVWKEFTIEEIVPLDSIVLSENVIILKPDDTYKLQSTPYPAKGIDDHFEWSVEPPTGVISISKDGVIKAIENGEAIVKVTSVMEPTISAECKVIVNDMTCTLWLLVENAKQEPIKGATITIKAQGGKQVLYTGETGSNGGYSNTIIRGNYTYTVTHPNYATATGDIDLNETNKVAVTLHSAGSTPNTPNTPNAPDAPDTGNTGNNTTNNTTPVITEALAETVVGPNPINDALHIWNAEKVQYYTLYDAVGKLIQREKHTGNTVCTIHTMELAPGMYLLCLQNQSGATKHVRIIKR